jgi:hypothetical protein
MRTIIVGAFAVVAFVSSAAIAASAAQAIESRTSEPPSSAASNAEPFVVSVPHHVGRREALRHLKAGLADLQRSYSFLFAIQQEVWTGYHLQFRASVLGQPATGAIDVTDREAHLTVLLPWLLAKLAEAARPMIVKEGTAMLDK